MGMEDRDYFRKKSEDMKRYKNMKDMYVNEDGEMFTKEEWDKKRKKSSDSTYNNSNINDKESTLVEVIVSTDQVYNNQIIDFYYNHSMHKFKLNSKMKNNETYQGIHLPCNIKLKIVDNSEFIKYSESIFKEEVKIDTSLAKFGGNKDLIINSQRINLLIPENIQNDTILKKKHNNKIFYFTIKILSQEDMLKYNKKKKQEKLERERSQKEKRLAKRNFIQKKIDWFTKHYIKTFLIFIAEVFIISELGFIFALIIFGMLVVYVIP